MRNMKKQPFSTDIRFSSALVEERWNHCCDSSVNQQLTHFQQGHTYLLHVKVILACFSFF